MEWSVSHVGNHDSRRQSWVMTFPQKEILFPMFFLQAWGARWRQSWVTLAIMTHVGNHDSRQSTALLYQFLRWNLSCNISWVRRNLLFKLGFLVPLRTDGFSCYNPTETRVREITRRRVKQIILSLSTVSVFLNDFRSGWGKKEISAPLQLFKLEKLLKRRLLNYGSGGYKDL